MSTAKTSDNMLEDLIPSTKPEKPHPWRGWRLFWKIFFILFIAMFIFIGSFFIRFLVLYSYHEVEGKSMFPTYNQYAYENNNNKYDRVFVRKNSKVKIGDVIVFKQTYEYSSINGEEEKALIKRVIAKGGDKVKIEEDPENRGNYILWIHFLGDAEPTNMQGKENFTFDNVSATENMYEKFIRHTPFGFLTVPEGEFFVLGDFRPNSIDSSSFGTISANQIVGTVHFTVYGQWSGIRKIFNNFRIMFVIKGR